MKFNKWMFIGIVLIVLSIIGIIASVPCVQRFFSLETDEVIDMYNKQRELLKNKYYVIEYNDRQYVLNCSFEDYIENKRCTILVVFKEEDVSGEPLPKITIYDYKESEAYHIVMNLSELHDKVVEIVNEKRNAGTMWVVLFLSVIGLLEGALIVYGSLEEEVEKQ